MDPHCCRTNCGRNVPFPVAKPLPKVTPLDSCITPERHCKGRAEVFFMPPEQPMVDTRDARNRPLNKRAMDLRQRGGVIRIGGSGRMQFGRHREGNVCQAGCTPDKGDLDKIDQDVQTSLPSTGDSEDLFPAGRQPSALAQPEFNTTLRLASRIRELEQQEPDLNCMVHQRLADCSCAAEHLREQTYKRLNYGRRDFQYGDLIPVEVNESILIRQVEAEKQALVEAHRPPVRSRDPGPDVRDLLHLAVQHEFPAPPQGGSTSGPPPSPPRPVGFDQLAKRAAHRHLQLFHPQPPDL